jgi:hypothetical protein
MLRISRGSACYSSMALLHNGSGGSRPDAVATLFSQRSGSRSLNRDAGQIAGLPINGKKYIELFQILKSLRAIQPGEPFHINHLAKKAAALFIAAKLSRCTKCPAGLAELPRFHFFNVESFIKRS